MDNSNFNAFLADVKKRAIALEAEEYVSMDVRKVLRDFLQLVENFGALQNDNVSVGADARVFKKRFDQAKQDIKASEKRIELLKSCGIALVGPVKSLSADIAVVADPVVSARMKMALQKLAEAILEISKI